MAYGDCKDLPRRTASDKELRDKAFNIVRNPRFDRYQCGLTSMIYNLFDKKPLVLVLQVVLTKVKLCDTKNWPKNYTNQLLGNLKNKRYTHL